MEAKARYVALQQQDMSKSNMRRGEEKEMSDDEKSW